MMPAADARLRERSMTAPAGSAIRRSALPRSTNWRLKKSCVGAPPPLRVGAEEGDHATPGRDPGDGGGGPGRRSGSSGVAIARKSLCKPLKRLKMGSDMSKRAGTRRRSGPTPLRLKFGGQGVAVARKSPSNPLKRLKTGSDRPRRAESAESHGRGPRRRPGQRPGPTPHRPKVSGAGRRARPKKSFQTIEKAQNRLGHDKAR